MHIHCLQHVPFENEAIIGKWATESGHSFTKTETYNECKFPELNEFDLLLIMGGPMGVYDENIHSWLKEEKRFIREAVTNNKSVLGICLGAQLIAEALGADVYKNRNKEIGWFPLEKAPDARTTPFFEIFPDKFYAFHWHGDTFDLPDGAVRLAGSSATENQAFLYRDRVLALQFHLESTTTSINKLIENCGDELAAEAEFIQDKEEIRNNFEYIPQTNELMCKIMKYIASIK